jgi:V/A-type H+-transporting ATPase subunit A
MTEQTVSAGRIVGINGNMVTVQFDHSVRQNEVAYVKIGDANLMAEVIRVRGNYVDLQVFEDTAGLRAGGYIEFSGNLLAVELGPGLLGRVYDGLQNPLNDLAAKTGFFLKPGMYLRALDVEKEWDFTPTAKVGDVLRAADTLGKVPEGIFDHRIMVPFTIQGNVTVQKIAPQGKYKIENEIAVVQNEAGDSVSVSMTQMWPVKIPITRYEERLRPKEQLVTQQRILDTFFPVARGGTYCIPGPFGAGKTVLQQLTARYANVDVVVVAACGERAGEVVETLREFPHLEDPRTGRTLMERTIIICNTSSMPVAAREASVYTAVTLAEYYRQMGLNVLVLADSTSRWAQAMREMSGRLEEIPGQEAFPAYLESTIASFYERAGIVRLNDGSIGSVTIGGTVSPAGGDFDEPVTQSTLKVVGAFHGLSRQRSDARRYPAIDPLDSWSKYPSIVPVEELQFAQRVLRDGNEVQQMMKVVEEEGTPIRDFLVYLKSEYLDAVYLQQDAFDPVDSACSADRQKLFFQFVTRVLRADLNFEEKNPARQFFHALAQATRDWNRMPMDGADFKKQEEKLNSMLAEVTKNA